MERRKAIMALGGIVAGSAVLAQTRVASAQTTTTMPAAGAPITATTYVPMTLSVGTAAKMSSALALTMATHPKVKQFAKFEVDEQTAIAQVLTDMNNPPPAPVSTKDQAALANLQGLSGRAFDVAYVQNQIDGHQELLAIQQAFLTGAVTSRDIEHVAVLARVSIMMHLTLLQELKQATSA